MSDTHDENHDKAASFAQPNVPLDEQRTGDRIVWIALSLAFVSTVVLYNTWIGIFAHMRRANFGSEPWTFQRMDELWQLWMLLPVTLIATVLAILRGSWNQRLMTVTIILLWMPYLLEIIQRTQRL